MEPLISLCMIVINEEDMLQRCLSSVKSAVDEIIIVDTGSTDRTMEIALQNDARLFWHPWENDFSLHRNQSIAEARGRWILQMDADECLEPGHEKKLRELVKKQSPDITHLRCLIHDYQRDDLVSEISTIRLFRNGVGAQYKNPIHERIIIPEGKGGQTDIVIRHFGYGLSQDRMDRKYERNHALLKEALKNNAEDPFALYYMAITLFEKDPAGSIQYGERLLGKLRPESLASSLFQNVYYLLAAAHMNMGAKSKAEEVCMEAIRRLPHYVDAYWIMTNIAFGKQDLKGVLKFAENYFEWMDHYLDNRNGFPSLSVYSINQGWRIRIRQIVAHLQLDQENDAKACAERLLIEDPEDEKAFEFGLGLIESLPTPPAISRKFLQLFPDHRLGERLSRQKTDIYLTHILEMSPERGRQALEAYMESNNLLPDVIPHIALRLYAEDRCDLINSLIRFRPSDVPDPELFDMVRLLETWEVESAISKIDVFLKRTGMPVNQSIESLEELSLLMRKIGHLMETEGNSLSAAMLREGAFIVHPSREAVEALWNSLVNLNALSRLKRYVGLCGKIGLLNCEDLKNFSKSFESNFGVIQ